MSQRGARCIEHAPKMSDSNYAEAATRASDTDNMRKQ